MLQQSILSMQPIKGVWPQLYSNGTITGASMKTSSIILALSLVWFILSIAGVFAGTATSNASVIANIYLATHFILKALEEKK